MEKKSSASFVSLSAFLHAAAFLGLALVPAFKDSLNQIQPIEMTTINSGDLGEAKEEPAAAALPAPAPEELPAVAPVKPAKAEPVKKAEVKTPPKPKMTALPKKKIIEIKPEENLAETEPTIAPIETQEAADKMVEQEAEAAPQMEEPIQSKPMSVEDQVVNSTVAEAAEQAVAKQMDEELPAPQPNTVVDRLSEIKSETPAEAHGSGVGAADAGNGSGDIDMGAVAGPSSDDLRSYLDLKQAAGNRPPQYPESSRRKGEQGQVLLHYYVTAQGTVKNIKIVNSSGFSELDKAATRSASQLKFVPGQEGWAAHTMVFSLQGEATPSPSRLRAAGNNARAESSNN